MIEFECQCGKHLKVRDALAGRRSRCPGCNATIRIPQSPGNPSAAPAPVTPAVQPETPTATPASTPAAPSPVVDIPQPAPPSTPAAPPTPSPDVAAPARPVRSPVVPAGASPTEVTFPADTQTIARAVKAAPSAELVGPPHRAARYCDAPSRNVSIPAGCVILATLLLPWAIGRDDVSMSWDFLRQGSPRQAVFIIALWVLGLAAVTTGAFLRGLTASLARAVIGGAGSILFFLAMLISLERVPAPPMDLPTQLVGLMSLAAMLALIVITRLRDRLGDGLTVRTIQGVAAGALFVMTGLMVTVMLRHFGRLSLRTDGAFALDYAFAVATCTMIVIAAIAHAVRAARPTEVAGTLITRSSWLLYAAMACWALYLCLRPSHLADKLGKAWISVNVLLIAGSFLLLLCHGLIHTIDHLASPQSQPDLATDPPPP